jgi:hypothetical protein
VIEKNKLFLVKDTTAIPLEKMMSKDFFGASRSNTQH